jgi:16S rRNA (cytosine1402-N4)-methyltransferase
MYHEPVLLGEVLEQLVTSMSGLYLDCTMGGGGHSRAILSRLDQSGRHWALDRDDDALAHVATLEWSRDSRFHVIHGAFSALDELLPPELLFTGVLMDLGVSSHQLDEASRGFSFMRQGPLDMRMDRRSGQSAAEFLRTANEHTLGECLRNYGEVKNWRRMAHVIHDARSSCSFAETTELVTLLEAAFGSHQSYKWLSQVFQALRIEVNGEMDELQSGLNQAFKRLAPGGRLAVISYHSLEDRLTKRSFRKWCGQEPDFTPRGAPRREQVALATAVTRKAIQPGDSEKTSNPRSRSARLRVIQKLGETS